MSKVSKPQHDIARTLYLLLPVQGVPKTLQEIRDQLRLLNEIRDPSDARLGRVIIGYFRDPRYSRDARFLKIDEFLSFEDLSARWTRVRIGPPVSVSAVGATGEPPNRKRIEEKLPTILGTCTRSAQTSFYLWDLLKEHFGVTKDNNRHYHQWLVALSDALKTDPGLLIVAVDAETDIPVEWMLATSHEQQVNDAVRGKIHEVIAFMQRDEHLIHLTRDLVHRFFVPRVVDETYDIHVYYRAVSKALADTPSAILISVEEGARWSEAWCLGERVQQVIDSRLDSILDWLRTMGAPQAVNVISRHFFTSLAELGSTDAVLAEVSQALADDPRFVPRPHGRWYYRHALTDAELDQMLTLLGSLDGGLTLDELVVQTIGLDACDTDAFERLAEDERFVSVAGQWFARGKVFHSLTDGDVDQLLTTLRQTGTGLRLTTLIQRVLNREAHLTDAEARLRADSRFREVLPGVWMAEDLQLPLECRIPVFNRPIRSETVSLVPEDEYTETEDLTVRETRPNGETVSHYQSQIIRTLSLLDVRHGNLVIDRAIANLMPPDDGSTVLFTDELGNEFMCWVDQENDLLQGLGRWFEERRLTFGDKIAIRATDQAGFLEVRPKGQRDERVYQEALQRQDVEKLIKSAQQARKSYRDLMIEVMGYCYQAAGEPVPLHREDIYNLVNYNRTASRSYIFSLLSLTDCPYEELRYFASHGRGYWSFDPKRKKAFEMKMKELVARVEQLRTENKRLQQSVTSAREGEVESTAEKARLTRQVREQEARIVELSTQNTRLSETNQRLSAVNEDELRQTKELTSQVSTLKTQVAEQATKLETLHSSQESLQKELADTQKDRDRLQDFQETRASQIEDLIQEKTSLERELAEVRVMIERLASQNTALQENADRLQSQVDTLANEKATLRQQHEQAVVELRSQMLAQRQEYENLVSNSETQEKELQRELQLERDRARQLREHLGGLERLNSMRAKEIAQLTSKVDRGRAALQSRLGRGFIILSRLLGGLDLSDL